MIKDMHPGVSVSSTAMAQINALVGAYIGKMTKTTLGARHVQTAVRLVLPAELAKGAISEGTKAVSKYTK